jgi:cell fate regulator YaaT (PSP1 superfamily)
MFISKEEKQYLFDQIKGLSKDMSLAASEITFLKAKIKVLEAKLAPIVTPKKPKTLAQKAKQREYMRKYTARKRAEKIALEQK